MKTTRTTYKRPTLTKVGSVKDLTLGEGLAGKDDTYMLLGWIPIPYGTNPGS